MTEDEKPKTEREDLKSALDRILVREKQAYRRGLVIMVVSITLGVGWLVYAAYRVQRQNEELSKRSADLNKKEEGLEASAKTLGDQSAQLLIATAALSRIQAGVKDPPAYAKDALHALGKYSEPAPDPTPEATPVPTGSNSTPRPTPKPTASPTALPTATPLQRNYGFIENNYRGKNGTVITVAVVAVGTPLLVAYRMDGVMRKLDATGVFTFTLDKSKQDITRLVMYFDFAFAGENAVYQVKMTASDGSVNSLRISSQEGLGVVRSFAFQAL